MYIQQLSFTDCIYVGMSSLIIQSVMFAYKLRKPLFIYWFGYACISELLINNEY